MLEFTIPGDPSDGSVNAAYRATGGKKNALIKSKRAEAFEHRVVLYGRLARSKNRAAVEAIRAAPVVAAEITAYLPRRSHAPGTKRLGHGDADASIKATLDPLQDWYGKGKLPGSKKPGKLKKAGAGLFRDDVLVVDCDLRKRYDPDRPRIEVKLWGIDEPETKTMDEHYPSHDHPASILHELAEVLAPCGCTEDECVPSTHEGQRYCASCDGDLPAVTRSHPVADKGEKSCQD